MRILIVDDSAVMRSLIRAVVCSDDSLQVAGTAADGESALHAVESLQPDLILLDIDMPVKDGLSTLRELRARGHRGPVIMCSSLTQRGARVTIEALACGASDYVTKPSGQAGREEGIRTLARDLIPKIKALTRSSALEAGPKPAPVLPMGFAGDELPGGESCPKVVAIGVSTGGPAALEMVLPALPDWFPLPVLVVQHMPELFTALLAERLNERCHLEVREAAEGDQVRAGNIFVARGNWHMEVLAAASAGAAPTLHLTQGPPENHCRPAVDVLFRSAATAYGSGVLAAVLTGMGSDGLAGCRLLRAAGSTVLAQDRATSAVWGMPGAVTTAGLANRVLSLDGVAPEIVRLAAGSVQRTA
ncbi:MAG TPA: chemotaxis response regulator protein-glutamate methylesterase [Terracidiphilus sp.]